MCRNIKTLYNFDPPATEEEIYLSSLQFVRKLSGFTRPSKANQTAFDRAVDKVSRAARELIDSLVTNAPPRDREVEAVKAPRDRPSASARRPLGRLMHRAQPATDRSQPVGFVSGSAGAAGDARRLRHHEREIESEAHRVRQGLSRGPRHCLDADPLGRRRQGDLFATIGGRRKAASGFPATATACRSKARPGRSDPFTLDGARRQALWPRRLRHEGLSRLRARLGAAVQVAQAEGADPHHRLL